jgi:hypothetical protein
MAWAMKMPALMTQKNAVTASNMATILKKAQRSDQRARGDAQSKGFRAIPNFRTEVMI